MGVSPRAAAEELFLGELAPAMLTRAQSSLLFVCPQLDGRVTGCAGVSQFSQALGLR
jgi:hypothetical protein